MVLLVVFGVVGVVLGCLVGFLLGCWRGARLRQPSHTTVVGDSGEVFRLLVLLQREGRLLDFILEDVGGVDDCVLGGAVRPLLGKLRGVLCDYVVFEPILGGVEGDVFTVESGFDASLVKVEGLLVGGAPFRGVIKHPGWRVVSHRVPAAVPGSGGLVVERAVVEVG